MTLRAARLKVLWNWSCVAFMESKGRLILWCGEGTRRRRERGAWDEKVWGGTRFGFCKPPERRVAPNASSASLGVQRWHEMRVL